MLAVNKMSGQLDFEDPKIITIVRVAYVTSCLIVFLAYSYAKKVIESKNDLTTFTMEKPASPFSQTPPESVTTTVKAYDLEQVSSALKSLYQGVAMMGFLHLYMKYTNPLVLQSIMPLKNLYENKIIQIHVLGRSGPEYRRPFKTESLFGGSKDEAAAAPSPAVDASKAKTD